MVSSKKVMEDDQLSEPGYIKTQQSEGKGT